MPEATRNRVRRTGLMRFRDIVRIFFIFSLLGLGAITEHSFGEEMRERVHRKWTPWSCVSWDGAWIPGAMPTRSPRSM